MIRTFPVLATLLAVVGMATAVQPGYLSAGRLAPLRFTEPPSSKPSVLLSLPCDEPSTNSPIPTNSLAPRAAEAVATPPVGHFEDNLASVTNEVVVTPQMLVGFYRDGIAGTNRDTGAVVPFGFMPPTAAPKPSSTAQYSSP